VQWLTIASLMVCSLHVFVLTALEVCQECPAFFALSSSISLSQYLVIHEKGRFKNGLE
jgi:hypothetical protein